MTAYAYDGAGHRVKKLVGENTRFVYGIGGQLLAEFDGGTGALKKEYVYRGGSLITIEPTAVNSNGTQYATGDHLGSPRVITNSSGVVVGRHDYQPFGTELGAGVGGRTTGMGFSSSGDNNRKKFTGYERDTETGLDFAQARYFSSTQGRFTSPDSLLGSIGNPQTLNRYAYVGNNPINFSDPTGRMAHQMTVSSSAGSNPGWGWDDPGYDPESILPDEVRQDMRAWEQRVQNTRDAIAANEAQANGDYETRDAIMARNSTLEYENPQNPSSALHEQLHSDSQAALADHSGDSQGRFAHVRVPIPSIYLPLIKSS